MHEALQQLADFWCCDISDFTGQTLRSLFESAENDHATVFWGCWTDAELDTVA